MQAANPYLYPAAILAAGLDGMAKQADPGPRCEGLCFDFSNGRCDRGQSCRFNHVNGGGGGRLCYKCNKRGHVSRDCPLKLEGDSVNGLTMGLSSNVAVSRLFGGGTGTGSSTVLGGGGGGGGNGSGAAAVGGAQGGGGGGGSSGHGTSGAGGAGAASGGGTDPIHAKFRPQLTDFLSSKARLPSLEFPSTLTREERRAVHDIATQLGLMHTSKGSGTQRRIVIWRKGKPPPGVDRAPESDQPKRKAGGSSLTVLGLFNSQAKRVREGGQSGRSGVGGTGWAGPA